MEVKMLNNTAVWIDAMLLHIDRD